MNVIHAWKQQNQVIRARTAHKTLYKILCQWNSPIADQNEYSLNQDLVTGLRNTEILVRTNLPQIYW